MTHHYGRNCPGWWEESPCETCHECSSNICYFLGFTLYLKIFLHRRENSCRVSLPVADVYWNIKALNCCTLLHVPANVNIPWCVCYTKRTKVEFCFVLFWMPGENSAESFLPSRVLQITPPRWEGLSAFFAWSFCDRLNFVDRINKVPSAHVGDAKINGIPWNYDR